YFIGVPVMGNAAFNTSMDHVNGVLARTAASLPDCTYIDVRAVLADASGAYAPLARTASGSVVKLRAADGVHISSVGSRLLAARLVEAIAAPSGLPRGEILAALDNRDITPVASAAATPVRPADLGRPVSPSLAALTAQTKEPAKPATTAAAPAPKIGTLAENAPDPAKAAPVADPAAKRQAAAPAPKIVTLAENAPAKAAAPVAAPAAKRQAEAPAPKIASLAEAAPSPAKAFASIAAAPAAGSYAVADRDTLWSVAKRLGVSPEALAAANPGIDPHRLSIGQQLNVPTGVDEMVAAKTRPERPAAAAPASRTHTVADGDNYWSVARAYGVSVAALTEANPGVDPTRLRIGQGLALPAAASATAARPSAGKHQAEAGVLPGAGYVVADGDNFWTIARRLGVGMDDLTRLNAGLDPQRLQPGQVLAVPENARADALRAPGQADGEARSISEAGLYPVAPGDTLWGLSRRFGVPLDALLAVNDEVDPARMRVGQLVTVPAEGAVAAADMLSFPVSAGDSLWSIARRFDINVEALVAANPGVDPLRLREGQTLRVPSSLAAVAASGAPKKPAAPADAAQATPSEAPSAPASPSVGSVDAPARQHVISEGDTIWNLARTYGVSAQRILAENAGLNPVRLQVGQVLRLPGVVVSMAAR
ncbi:MAG: LysM peptidoglycan-binding domain-containing protein, partial [Acidobacteriota bacterium]